MKATAIAPANIAFIKYWGKADESLRLPLNSSISMNLTGAYTTTTVEFSPQYSSDSVSLLDGSFSDKETARVVTALTRIREKVNLKQYAWVVTRNSFPKGTGAAASASGFAALTVAAFAAAGIRLSERELTIFARFGSGSACRSIPDGFVIWEAGKTSDTSIAYSLFPHTYWGLRDILLIVDSSMKKVSTTEGQEGVQTSPLWKSRVASIPLKIEKTKSALREKNFQALGQLIEEDCLNMHRVMQTQKPVVMYWNKQTRAIMEAVKTWRKHGLPVYFTIDAGPNVHLICEEKDEQAVLLHVAELTGIESVIRNQPAAGTQIAEQHLF